jgi:hypothetical protein
LGKENKDNFGAKYMRRNGGLSIKIKTVAVKRKKRFNM